MKVAGYPVNQAGWYTFSYVFESDSEGDLTVNFELLKNNQTLHTVAIENTLNTGELTSSFSTSDLGSGYLWFASIADGLQLPIDEHRLHPGK
jgi:hypothetical protein